MRADNEAAESAVRVNTLRATACDEVVTELAQAGVAATRDGDVPEALLLEQPYDCTGRRCSARGR